MRSLCIGLAIAFVSLAADLWSKYYIFNLIDSSPTGTIRVLPFFDLVRVHNYGVSFGMFNNLENGKLILSIVALSITIGLCVWLYKVTKMYMICALGLIIGGAAGNIYDRVKYGAVRDFIDVYIGNYHWPAFNIADSTIFIGVAILLVDSFVNRDEHKREEQKNEQNTS
ncbi:MAG: signal peptidase II [Alphaproteobacteria bacterium CG11_big_fil_rev_8_21_14_0_20_39_49]|nr:MAG: signal peptidase II [Alphaproteobacteria bacterium CG11_big_fil_rev_8_21_14_0_20_39_49]